MVHIIGPRFDPHLEQLEDQFHTQYHSEAAEAGIADLAQVKQKLGESVSEYV